MKKLLAALAIITGFGTLTIGAADGGVRADLEVRYYFDDFFGDADGVTAADSAVGELYQHLDPDGFEDVTAEKCEKLDPSGNSNFTMLCNELPGDTLFTVGIDQLDDFFVRDALCGVQAQQNISDERIKVGEPTFTQPELGYAWCDVYLSPKPFLHIDKIVNGGDLGVGDFPLEVYHSDGQVDLGTDPSADLCDFKQPLPTQPPNADLGVANPEDCASIRLEPGNYTIGEILPEYGYAAGSFDCTVESNPNVLILDDEVEQPEERLGPEEMYAFPHGQEQLILQEIPFYPSTLCRLTNDYVEVDVTADLVVINDDGGEEPAGAFTIEVYDSSGTIVAEGVDPDPGEGNDLVDFVLPIGDYTFGVRGPEGYTASAVVNVTPQEATEIIPTGADFTAAVGQDVAGIITVDDPPAEPGPTTIAPTTVAPTTVAPTTVAPTTTMSVVPTTVAPTTQAPTQTPTTLAPAPAPPSPPTTITMILPETGGSGDETGIILLMAIGALLIGGGAVLATRRS